MKNKQFPVTLPTYMDWHQLITDCSSIAFVLLFAWGLDFVLKKVAGKIREKAQTLPLLLTGIETLYPPLTYLIYGLGALFIWDILARMFGLDLSYFELKQIKQLLFLSLVTWYILRWKRALEKKLEKEKLEEDVEKRALFNTLSRMLSIFIFSISGLLALDILHIPIGALLAFGGIGGLAISWAGKDVIANFFGGLMIYVNRHITVGDLISSPNKHFEGMVEEIGWYQTKIRSLERCPTYIPNGLITDAIIENKGRRYHRRIQVSFSLRYKDLDKLKPLLKELKERIKKHPRVDTKEQIVVAFKEYGAHSLEILVYAFTKTIGFVPFFDVQQEILFLVHEIVREFDVDFAFPTQDLHIFQQE